MDKKIDFNYFTPAFIIAIIELFPNFKKAKTINFCVK